MWDRDEGKGLEASLDDAHVVVILKYSGIMFPGSYFLPMNFFHREVLFVIYHQAGAVLDAITQNSTQQIQSFDHATVS